MKSGMDTSRLRRKLADLPDRIKDEIGKAVEKGVDEGVRVARILAPVDSGQTRDDIVKVMSQDRMRGEVQAIDPDATRPEKDRAYSIEHGRKRGNHGTTEGSHHMQQTRQFMAKRARGRIRRAVNKAAKELAGRG